MTKNFVLPRKEKKKEFWDDEMDKRHLVQREKQSSVISYSCQKGEEKFPLIDFFSGRSYCIEVEAREEMPLTGERAPAISDHS
jgi:hypothetical protein